MALLYRVTSDIMTTMPTLLCGDMSIVCVEEQEEGRHFQTIRTLHSPPSSSKMGGR